MEQTVAAYFDQRSLTWDDVSEPAGDKHRAIALLAGVTKGARVLDIGCGTGIMARAYLDCGARAVTGLDVSPGMVARAQAKFASCENVAFEAHDVIDYRSDEPFDVAVMYNMYPHVRDKQALVRAVARLLRPQGRFLVAHGMGRAQLNAHHGNVPASVTSTLPPAEQAAEDWRGLFQVEAVADMSHLYFFGGRRRD